MPEASIKTVVHRLRNSFDVCRLVFEQGDRETALVMARWLHGRLETALEELKKRDKETERYIEMVSRKKIPSFRDDAAWFESTAAALEKGKAEADLSGLPERLDRLDGSISFASKLADSFDDSPSSIFMALKKLQKPVLIGAAAVAGFLLVQWGVRAYFWRGHGLVGEYYADKDFQTLHKVRRDYKIDFDWGEAAPLRGLKSDEFSVRWTGYLDVPESGPYEFLTLSDDGVRLWIDDRPIIDNWTRHWPELDRGSVDLSAGLHKIRLDYFENHLSATIKLYWRKKGLLQKKIIKPKYLYVQKTGS